MDPPRHAVVLSLDEKSQIQALERTRPSRPVTPGRPETQTHDYVRHGTTTLFAALNVLEGTVIGRCMQRHRHDEFLGLPQHHRDGGASRQTDPRDPGQLRHPQAPESASLAGPASALDLPLHPDFGLVDERGRGLLLRPDPAQAEAGQLQRDRRPASGDQPLHCPAERKAEALRVDQAGRRHPRCRQWQRCTIRMSQCLASPCKASRGYQGQSSREHGVRCAQTAKAPGVDGACPNRY